MSVARSSLLFAIGTLISRFSGVARESVIGAVFGASIFMDAFVVAFRIPNLLRELLAEGALGSSFTKVYSGLCVEDKEAANRLLIQTLQFVVMVTIAVCAFGIFFADDLVALMTLLDSHDPKFNGITVALTQLMFPFIGFAAIGAVVQGALYQRGGFFLAGVAPILFNLFSIIGAIWLAPLLRDHLPGEFADKFGDAGILGLAVGTLLGGAAQSAIQAWGIWQPLLKNHRLIPRQLPWSKDIRKILILMGPMVIAASAGQINVIVNTNFATSLETGAVTWLYFAFRLVQLPIGMFGVAVGAAILPTLTKSITEAHGKVDVKASREIINAMDLVAWLMIPCTLALVIGSQDLTRVLYEAGQFGERDTNATAIAIEAYSYGLLGYGILKVMNSYYYATGRTKFPMAVSIFSILANYVANALFVKKFGHQGLAITASVTLTLNSLLLIAGMSVDKVQVNWLEILKSVFLLAIGSVLVLLIYRSYSPLLNSWSLSTLILGQDTTILAKKIDALVRLSIATFVIITIFGAIGLTRIGKTPRQALQMLKRKK
ncbi:MAG: murein biosynthesis integral membrane protein MurJ [bacterium]